MSDPSQIVEHSCQFFIFSSSSCFFFFFTDIGPNLANNIPPSSKSHVPLYLGILQIQNSFDTASEQEIIDICLTFTYGTAVGCDQNDGLSYIKDCAHFICRPLTHLSMTSGIVLDQLKIVLVIPLFKSGDKSSFLNYRPVSVLTSFSRILEKVIYNHLLDCL